MLVKVIFLEPITKTKWWIPFGCCRKYYVPSLTRVPINPKGPVKIRKLSDIIFTVYTEYFLLKNFLTQLSNLRIQYFIYQIDLAKRCNVNFWKLRVNMTTLAFNSSKILMPFDTPLNTKRSTPESSGFFGVRKSQPRNPRVWKINFPCHS